MKSKQNKYFTLENLFLALFSIIPFLSLLSIQLPIILIKNRPLMGLLKEILIMMSMLLILYSFFKSNKIKIKKKYFLLIIYLIYGAFHIISKADLIYSIDKFRLIYLYPIYFLAILYFIQNEDKHNFNTIIDKLKKIFLVQIIIMSIFAILQIIFKGDLLLLLYKEQYFSMHVNLLGKSDLRLVSLMLNPINFALFCNIAIAFLLYSNLKRPKLKWILIVLLSIFILLTFSRIGYLILIAEIVIYLLFFNWDIKRNSIIFIIASLSLITIILLLNFEIIKDTDFPVLQRFTQLDLYSLTQNDRISDWKNYLDNIFDDNIFKRIWGVGLGTASSNSSLTTSSPNINLVESSYISILGELGILGLVLYTSVIIKYIYNSFSIKIHNNKKFYFLITLLAIILIGGLTNNTHYNNPFSYYFWLSYFYTEVYMLNKGDKMGKIKIAYIITGLTAGGAEMQLFKIISNLDRSKFEPLVISMTSGGIVRQKLSNINVPVYDLGLKGGKWTLKGISKLYKILKKERPSILNSFLFHANITARIFGRLAGVPIIVSSIRNSNFGGKKREKILKYTNFLADLVTINSKNAGDKILNEKIVSKDKLKVMVNGIDLTNFEEISVEEKRNLKLKLGLNEKDFIWLAVGRFHKQKDYKTLVNSFKILLENRSNIKLLIAGDGELRTEYENLASKLDIMGDVIFLGERKDIPQLMNISDAYVMSSQWEGMPNVIMEAAASSLPIVSTNVGGTSELVKDQETGILVKPKSKEELSLGMKKILDMTKSDRIMMGLKGKEYISKQYDIKDIANKWEILYLQLLNKKFKNK